VPASQLHGSQGQSQGSGLRRDRATRTGLDAPVLVLNRHFSPVRITTARQAFLLLYIGRARALDRRFEPHPWDAWASSPLEPGDETVGTPRGKIRVPRVLLLSGYSRTPQAPLRLSRRNIFVRDGFTCQYCGVRPGVRDLNLDHVVPRSRGGRSSWENLVTSCRDCNLGKGWSTPDEAGLTLRSTPKRPSWSMALMMAAPSSRYPEWEPFLVGIGPPPRDPGDERGPDDESDEADAAE
jgi:5-methylcytosine-specific restriction endonuclease McrA